MIRVLVRQRSDRPNLQLAYTCPLTGEIKTKSAGTRDWDAAQREAAKWETELAAYRGTDCSWQAFRERFLVEYLPDVRKGTAAQYHFALNHFENMIGDVRSMKTIDASVCSRFTAALRDSGMKPATVAKTLRHFKAALRWCESMGIIDKAPRIAMPKMGGARRAKGRPLTDDEFKSILNAIPKDEYRDAWTRFFNGLWLSGLRVSEAVMLSWDSPPVQVDLFGKYPAIVFDADGQKAGRRERVPVTPDFAELLASTPAADRTGQVFKLHLTNVKNVGRFVSSMGKSAGVFVGPNKFATAHDFRRSFGTRWALKIHPLTLRAIMRHADLKTTMAYYVDLDADRIADDLYTSMYTSSRKKRKPAKPK